MTQIGEIAVLDVGKTNVDLWVAAADGTLLEKTSRANRVIAGPPWRHHDLFALTDWVGEALASVCQKHPIRVVVPVGHGSGGVLTGDDPDENGTGLALPMIDYEQPCPPEIDAEYSQLAGSFEDRGSPVMMASTHAARQILWMERTQPAGFQKARHYLNIAQYWGWWLTGKTASEYSAMGAQSHLWNVPQRRWTPIVESRGWQRLMPDFRPAWSALGTIRQPLVRRYGLPADVNVLTGGHDSTANFYRYYGQGMRDFTLVSTGTWIVGLSREADLSALNETRSATINADMEGHPIGGGLVMGGREFSAIAGKSWKGAPADAEVLARLVAQKTMAIPSFSENEGQFPGSGGRGRILGPSPANQAERTALALLYTALLTATCADVLKGGDTLVLDGTFLKEPLFAPLVAALRGSRPTVLSDEPNGVVAGAVRLVDHEAKSRLQGVSLEQVLPSTIPGLAEYFECWRTAAHEKGCTKHD